MNAGGRAGMRTIVVWSLLVAFLTTLAGTAVGTPPASAAVVGDAYVPMSPVRALDTRSGTTPAGGSTTRLPVAGRLGVPATARAVVLNVTAVGPATAGYLTVFPAGGSRPTASNLNFIAGQTIANQVIIDVGSSGSIAIYASARTNILVDVAGYFPSARSFTGVAPTRVLDTRSSGAAPSASTSTQVRVSGVAGVPVDRAKAVVVNVTAVTPSAAGYLSVHPGGTRPDASNVNFRPGQNIAGLVVAKVAADGTITIFTSAKTHLLVDVLGWLPQESSIRPITPARLLDTRTGPAPVAGSSLKVAVTGRAGVPRSGVSVVELTVTAVAPSRAGYLTVHPGGTAPTASNLNFAAGQTIANSVTAKVGTDGTVTVRVSATSHVLVDLVGFGVPTGAPSWSDPVQVIRSTEEVTGIACPTASFCVAVDDNGSMTRWDGFGWKDRLQEPMTSWTAVSCATAAACVATGTRPSTGGARTPVFAVFDGSNWGVSRPLPGSAPITGVSCPATDFCLGVGREAGRSVVLSYDGQAWTQQAAPNVAGLTVVSCVSAQFCIAGSTTGGAVRWTGAGAEWRYSPEYLDTDVTSVSCASKDLCLMTGRGYGIVSMRGDRVTPHYDAPWALDPKASCSSPSQCTIVADNREMTYSPATDTFSAGNTSDGSFNAISCPTDIVCGRAHTDGAVSAKTDPYSSPLKHIVASGQGSITDVDCPVVGSCVMADFAGNRFRVDGASIGPIFAGPRSPTAISCSGVDHCMTVGQGAGVTSRTMMVDGVWSSIPDTGIDRDVSCPTASFCMTVGQRGTYLWDGAAWRKVASGGLPAHLVHCVDPTWCVTVTNGSKDLAGHNGARIQLWDGRSWVDQVAAMEGVEVRDIDCTARNECLLITRDGRSARLTAQGWSQPSAAPADLDAVSCASATWCLALDRSSGTHLWDGSAWSVVDTLAGEVYAISCPAIGRCVAAGDGGALRFFG